jgi:hypothetical protein
VLDAKFSVSVAAVEAEAAKAITVTVAKAIAAITGWLTANNCSFAHISFKVAP